MSFRFALVIAGAAICVTAPTLSAQTAQPAPTRSGFYDAVECAAAFKADGRWFDEAQKATAIAHSRIPADGPKDEAGLRRMIEQEAEFMVSGGPKFPPMSMDQLEELLTDCRTWLAAQPDPRSAKASTTKP